MLSSFIIVFREVLEAVLIIGIVSAVASGLPRLKSLLTTGIGLGVLAALLVALGADSLASAAQGYGEEIFNAIALLLAVVLLTWHLVWMQRHGRELMLRMRHLGQAVVDGGSSHWTLVLLISVAVLREGAEIVLFLQGVAVSMQDQADIGKQMFVGGLLGIGSGGLLGWLLFKGLLRIPLKYFFSLTSWFILLITAGLSAQAAKYLQQAHLLPNLGVGLWDSSNILSEQSLLGQVLHTMVGYVARPDGIQVLFYLVTLFCIAIGMNRVKKKMNESIARSYSVAN